MEDKLKTWEDVMVYSCVAFSFLIFSPFCPIAYGRNGRNGEKKGRTLLLRC